MNLGLEWMPTPAGLLVAGAAIAAGAPLFSDGLRAVRLSRALRRLRIARLAECATGMHHVSGQVALESPLFSPLTGVACAGYVLDVLARDGAIASRIETLRNFRLVDGGVRADVDADAGHLELFPGTTRTIGAHELLSDNLSALLARVPEALLHRRNGGALTLTERVLAAGATCHIVGMVRHSAMPGVVVTELLGTGTGDMVEVEHIETASEQPDVWINSGEHLRFLWIADRAPDAAAVRIPPARALGVVFGPMLSLAGMLYLANIADHLRSQGRF